MNNGDRFRIINNAGIMEVWIWGPITKAKMERDGISLARNGNLRVESHKGDNGALLVTLYENYEDNRIIYIIEYDGDKVAYYCGKIQAFEHESLKVYRTV